MSKDWLNIDWSNNNWLNNNSNDWLNNNNNSLEDPSKKFRQVGKDFLTQYYNTYDTDRTKLYNYYSDIATMTFQKDELRGKSAIQGKYASLPLNKPTHKVLSASYQPLGKNKIVILVTGTINYNNNSNSESWLSFEHDSNKKCNYVENFVLWHKDNKWFIQSHIFNIV